MIYVKIITGKLRDFMKCEDCLLWFSMNQHTGIGACNHPKHKERGEFTFMRTSENTRCSRGIRATWWWKQLNKSQSAQRYNLLNAAPQQLVRVK